MKRILILCAVLWLPVLLAAQQADSLLQDTVYVQIPDDSFWVYEAPVPPVAGPEYLQDMPTSVPSVIIAADEVSIRNYERHKPWLFVVFMLQLVLLVVVRLIFEKNVAEQIRAYFNINLSQQLHRDQETSLPFSSLVLNLNGFISYGMLTYLTLFYLPGWDDLYRFKLLGSLVLVATVVFSGKYLLARFIAHVFPFTDELSLYNFNFFLNHQLVGVLLIPLNMVIAYAVAPTDYYALWVSWGLIVLSYMLLAVKGFSIGGKYFRLYKFHFILYICTLEIAPLLIILKVFQQLALNNQH